MEYEIAKTDIPLFSGYEDIRRRNGVRAPFFRTETQARLLALLFLRPHDTWTLASLARAGPLRVHLHPDVHAGRVGPEGPSAGHAF